jgi:hypothetical protein
LVKTHIVVNLPIKPGEEWHVNQGMNSELWSHMSSSAFCYDLGLNAGPDATVFAPVYCVKKGKVIEYKDDDDSAPREGNRIILKIDKTRAFGYLHLKKGSLNMDIQGGTPVDPNEVPDSGDEYNTFAENVAPVLDFAALVGKTGPNAKHLHCDRRFEIGNYVGNNSHTTPLAFRNYKVYNNNTGYMGSCRCWVSSAAILFWTLDSLGDFLFPKLSP